MPANAREMHPTKTRQRRARLGQTDRATHPAPYLRMARTLISAAAMLVVSGTALSQTDADAEGSLTSDPATLKRGKILFLQCQACHSLGAGEAHRVGPNLHGLFGRKAGSAEGFNYSEAMKATGIVWDSAELDAFITMPSTKVPGTIMAFAGVAAEGDRVALLSYLRSQTNP